MTTQLSDRDFVIETMNELEEMLKQLVLKALTAPSGEAQYLMHTTTQTIRLARLFNVIAGCEQNALEKMLAIRNQFAHSNGLSFASEVIESQMGAIRDFIKAENCPDRVVFGLVYNEMVTRFLLRLGGGV